MRSITKSKQTFKQFAATLVAVAVVLATIVAHSSTALAPNVIKSYGGLGTNTGQMGSGWYLVSGSPTPIVRFPDNQQIFHSIAIGTPCYGLSESVTYGTETTKVISAGAGGRKICR